MEKTFEVFSLYEYEKSDPWGGVIFDHRVIICTILLDVHKIKLHIKYQRPRPSYFIIKVLPIGL